MAVRPAENVATPDGVAASQNDLLNEAMAKMIEADGIILGSPVYFNADVTTEMKALVSHWPDMPHAAAAICWREKWEPGWW